jgi:hypothetical protein
MDSPSLDRGLRIKTNARRGGIIENVFMRNTMIVQVKETPLKINYYYQEGNKGDFPPTVQNIFLTNVHCCKSKYPWHIRGYEYNKVQNVVLKGCVFENTTYKGVAEGFENLIILSGEDKFKVSEPW